MKVISAVQARIIVHPVLAVLQGVRLVLYNLLISGKEYGIAWMYENSNSNWRRDVMYEKPRIFNL